MKNIIYVLALLFLLGMGTAAAQTVNFEDGFEDSTFSANPAWSGDTNEFIIDGYPNHLLHSQGNPAGGISHLSVPSTNVTGYWEFYINLDFSPSGGNFAEIFLMSDIANLEGPVNGYALQAGESGTNDVFRIVRYDNGNSTTFLSDTTDIHSGGEFRVKITRDASGNWTLEVGNGYDGILQQEATGTDNTYTSTSYFGVKATYTSSRAQDFYFDFKIDLPPFTVTRASVTGSQVTLTFNRAYDQATIQASDFNIDNGVGTPNSVSFPSATTVQLNYPGAIPSGNYTLSAQAMQDISGKPIEPNTSVSFIVYAPFSLGDVIINEFMYDPPTGQAEYVEIRNLSSKYLNLHNWQLADESGTDPIATDTLTLEPNSYLVITADSITLKSIYGPRSYFQMANFPSFNNDGDAIALTSANSILVDSLNYTSAWGGNKTSLERRSSTAPSVQANFANSPNASGGTPGLLNEVDEDTSPPSLSSLVINDGQTLTLAFTEGLQAGPAENENNYLLNNGIIISTAVQIAPDSVQLTLGSSLQNNTNYQLSINNQQDIFGNTAAIDTSFTYYVISPVDSDDIFINEFMYDPPTGQTEYIELYNPTNKSLNLQGWTLNDSGSQPITITDSQFILPPQSYVVIAPDNTLLSTNPGMPLLIMGNNFPSFNNGGDNIVIKDSIGTELDSLQYTSDWGGENIALERRTINVPPIQPNFGNAPNGFGTPGAVNEIVPDTTPPTLEAFSIIDNQTLVLIFSEGLTTSSAENVNNYSISGGIAISAAVLSADTVNLTLSTPLQNNTIYTITGQNISDLFGNTASVDTSFTYFEPSLVDGDDVYINEFMYDPPSGQTEYIELYNPTNKSLDLKDWTLNDNSGNPQIITNSQFIIPPKSYVVLAPDATLLVDNPNITLIQMGSNFPSFNNSGDDIVVKSATGLPLDSLRYSDDWGGNEVALERRSINALPLQPNFGVAPNGFGTPGAVNEIAPDTTPPTLEAFSIIDNQTLVLIFSEGLTTSSAENINNYSISGGLTISAAILSADTVQLTLSGAIQNNTAYTVSGQNLSDLFGNTASVDTSFTYFEPSPVDGDDVFINEFMYDPPSGQTEYIELYNSTNKSLDLKDWTLNDNSGNPQIITNSQFIIPPKSYVVLAPDATLLVDNPNITLIQMGSNFPSLNNSGDDIIVKSAGGLPLDSLRYSDDWGGNEVALERRTINVAPVQANFGVSPDSTGTPGSENKILPDTTPPSLKTFIIVNSTMVKLVFSEQLDVSSATEKSNYAISGGLSIATATLLADTVNLALSAPLQNNTIYTITGQNISDLFGNTASVDTSFTYFEPSPVDGDDVFINEFMYDPPSGQTEYIELYNPTNKSLNLQGWTLNDSGSQPITITDSQFILPPQSYVVLAPDATLLVDNPNITLIQMGNNFPSLNNSGDDIVVKSAGGLPLDSLRYSDDWGGNEVVLERRTINVAPVQANFGVSPDSTGTPGSENKILPDTTPPSLKTFIIVNSTMVKLVFNEQLDVSSATEKNNYAISGGLSIAAATLLADTVALTFSESLQNNVLYTLSASNISDLFGNTASVDTSFTYFEPSPVDGDDVYINEFMYDPPSGQTEYIELYNPTNKSLDLKDWTLNDNSGNPKIITDSQFIIPPKGYVVLAPDATLLVDNPNITLIQMGSNFPSLNNSGDDIVVKSAGGLPLDSLRYSDDWGGNEVALERRTITVQPIQANFGVSPDSTGTPGSENKILPDTTPPELAAFSIIDNQTVALILSEGLTTSSAENITNYSISGGITISAAVLSADTVQLTLSGPLQNNTAYTVSGQNLSDLFGNTASVDTSFTYFEPSPVDGDDVFINEFMYDPPSGQTEYIELYNPTNKSLDLKDWTLNDNSGNPQIITNSQFIIPPKSYVVLAPDATLLVDNPNITLIQMGSNFPSLNNSGDDIVVKSAGGLPLDSLRYNDDWGGNEVALERRSINALPLQPNFAEAPNGFGTPGNINEIEQDKTAPRLLSAEVVDSTQIKLLFSEPISASTANLSANYSFNPKIDINLIASIGNKITLFLKKPMVSETAYTLTINNQQDIFGNTIQTTQKTLVYVRVSQAQPKSIVINEFLVNGEPEFVELYNRSNKNIDLSGWSIGDENNTALIGEKLAADVTSTGPPKAMDRTVPIDKNLILHPGEYLVITTSTSMANSLDNGIRIADLPSFNDDEDVIYIQDVHGTVIDSLKYTPAFGTTIDGTSAERKDPNAASNDPFNWHSSTSTQNYTAGKENSVYQPDTNPPEIIFAELLPNGNIGVNFNEFITTTSDLSFKINDQQTDIVDFNPSQGNYIILKAAGLTGGQSITVTASEVRDIGGNITATTSLPVAQPLNKGDVVINEIMFDPIDTSDDELPDQSEYVELYNTKDYAIALEGVTLRNAPDEDGEIDRLDPVSSELKWISAHGTAIIYADEKSVFIQSDIAKFFDLDDNLSRSIIRVNASSLSLASSNDAIFLSSKTGVTIDSVYYDETWHNPNLIDTDGIALERLNPSGSSNNASNWGSSTAAKGGTPNTENTLFQEPVENSQNYGIFFSSGGQKGDKVFSPDGDGYDDVLNIHYNLKEADYLMTVQIYDRYGRLIIELADSKPAGNHGILTWKGLKENGNRNRIGIYIVIFRAFDSANGKDAAFKKTVVLARKLN